MNISKAIKILTIHNDHNPDFTDADREEAHQLSIEALKYYQRERERRGATKTMWLPGETEE